MVTALNAGISLHIPDKFCIFFFSKFRILKFLYFLISKLVRKVNIILKCLWKEYKRVKVKKIQYLIIHQYLLCSVFPVLKETKEKQKLAH